MAFLLQSKIRVPDAPAMYNFSNEAEFRRIVETIINTLAGVEITSGGGGGVTDGDKGDITVSGSGATWNIDAGVVGTTELGGDITAAGKALLDDANAAAQRTTLGLGSAAVEAASAFAAAVHTHLFADLPDIATDSFLGRDTAGTGDIENLTGTQATSLLDVFTSSLKGLAPASGGGTSNFLRADGTWAAPGGGGGPGTGTQYRLPVWATTTSLGDSSLREGLTAGLLEIGLNAVRGVIDLTHAPGLNADGFALDVYGTITRNASGSHPSAASVRLRQPSISGSGAVITNCATLRIDDAPAIGTNRYALHIVAGVAYLGGGATFPVGGTVQFLNNPGMTINPGAGATAISISTGILPWSTLGAGVVATGNAGYLMQINGTLTEASSGTHSFMASLWLAAPTITNGSATTTNAATLYIAGAPTGITPTNTARALWVGAGLSFFEGPVRAQMFRIQKQTFTNGASITPAITSGAFVHWDLTVAASDNPVTVNAVSGGTDGDVLVITVYNSRAGSVTVNFATGYTMTAASESVSMATNTRASWTFIYNSAYSSWFMLSHESGMAAST